MYKKMIATQYPLDVVAQRDAMLLFIFFIKHIYEMKLHYKNKKIKYEIKRHSTRVIYLQPEKFDRFSGANVWSSPLPYLVARPGPRR